MRGNRDRIPVRVHEGDEPRRPVESTDARAGGVHLHPAREIKIEKGEDVRLEGDRGVQHDAVGEYPDVRLCAERERADGEGAVEIHLQSPDASLRTQPVADAEQNPGEARGAREGDLVAGLDDRRAGVHVRACRVDLQEGGGGKLEPGGSHVSAHGQAPGDPRAGDLDKTRSVDGPEEAEPECGGCGELEEIRTAARLKCPSNVQKPPSVMVASKRATM